MGIGYECGGVIPSRGERGHLPPLSENPELTAHLERARLRREAEQAAARRTRLHYFGLAGGRR